MKQTILFIYIFAFFLTVNAACPNGQVEAVITKTNDYWCEEESVSIYLGTSTTDTPLFTRGWTSDDEKQTTTDTICIIPDTTYTALLSDSAGDGWGQYSFLSVAVYGNVVLNLVRFASGSSGTYTFSFNSLIPYGSAIKYTNIPQIGNEWTSESFTDSTWTEYTAGNFPEVSSITRYYRVIASFESNNLYGLNISIKAKDGYILYANGVEQYRYGLPSTSDANTLATITGTSYVERVIAIRTDTFLTGNSVTIAVELHGVSTYDIVQDGFDLMVYGYVGDSGTINHVYIPPTNTQCAIKVTSSDSDCPQIFDNSLDTNFVFLGQASVDIVLYNGAIKLNGYEITCSGIDACPKDWILYGTIDNGDTWFYIDSQTSQTFSESNPTHNYLTRSNSLAINGLKLDITANNGASTTKLNELRPLLINYPTLSPGIQYENEATTFNGETYVYMSMTVVSSGFTNFSITPDLPIGLTFDPKTGNISGTPRVGVNQEYIVSANIGNSDSITSRIITINIIDCSPLTITDLKFVKYDNNGAKNEKFFVKDQNSVIILNKSGTITVSNTKMCKDIHDAGIYEVTLTSETHNGWYEGSYLDVFLINKNVNTEYRIERFYLFEDNESTYKFNTKLDIAYKSTWKYLDSDTINSEWYFVDFEDSSWTTMDYITLPQTNQKVILFRKTISDITRSDYKGIELQIYSRDGIVVYANGNEMYRINLAEDDITIDTTATATSDYVWRKVTLPISVISTTDTSLTLAIAQVSTETAPYTLKFDCTLRFIPSNDIIQTYTGTQSSDTSVYDRMFDMNIWNYYESGYHNSQTEHWTQILFSDQGAIFANKYCIINSYQSQIDISDWKIYGTTDGSTWNQLSSETNISWNSSFQRRCFYISNLSKPQLGYRFAPTKNVLISSKFYAASEMEFYVDDIIIPLLAMTPSHIIAYKGADVPKLVPNCDYYHDFSISPSLPSPLLLDSYDGSIKNIPSTVQSATEYTITATDIQGHTSSTSITLTIIACSSPNTILTLQLEFKQNSHYNALYASWIIKIPSNAILDSKRHGRDNAIETFSYCVIAGTYTFTFSTTYSSWGNGVYYIKNRFDETLQSGTVTKAESPKIINVSIGKLLGEDGNNWKYLQEDTQPPSTWITSDFSDETWSTALSSLIPVPSSTTQYYRTNFSMESIDSIHNAAIEFAAASYAGLIFYMNGQEIMRFNMPSGDVTKNTLATSGSDSYVYYKSSFPISSNYVIMGTNIVAVEVHKFDIIPSSNTFDAYIQFVLNDSYRIIDGISSSDIENIGSEGYANVFDGNKNTYTYSGPRCVGGYYTWTYNNGRREFINKLSVTNYNSGCYNRNPSGWILEGSNDNGVTWNILFDTQNQSFTTPSQTIENAFYSNNSYNSYRYTVTQCNNVDSNNCSTGLELSEISFSVDNILISCEADGVWGPAPEGGSSFQSCSFGYIGYKRCVCIDGVLGDEADHCVLKPPMSLKYPEISYTMTRGIEITSIIPLVDTIELTFTSKPTLPGGLILDSTTGIISGTPINSSDSKQFIITATNGGGSISSTLTIIIKKSCLQDNNWPITGIDDSVSIPCPDTNNYEGELVRTCINNNNEPEWSIITDNCYLKKPMIIYSLTTIIGYTHQLFPIINVSTTGLFYTVSIEPELPSGLIFDSTNGHIYGTPIIAYETTEYIITIENISGKNTIVLTITIELSKCPQDNEWEETNANEIASHSCSGSLVGSITRQCSSNGEWKEPINNCVGCYGVYYKSGNECIVCDHGIVSGDNESNINCESCDFTTHYIQNNECIVKNICEAGIYESIDWHNTLPGYSDIIDCEDKDNIGFYSRQCDYNSYTLGWSDVVDKSSCKSKNINSGGALVYVQLPINGLASYQYNNDIDLYVIRAFIVENQYSIYDVDISVPNTYNEDNYMTSTIYAFLYTSISRLSSVIQNNEQNTDHLLETLHKYDSKIFNNQLSVNKPSINKVDTQLFCSDPTSETEIPIGSTTPNQCNEDIDGYMEYECIQYHLEPSLKENGYVKCHPSEPTIIPTESPSTTPTTTPTETPTSTPINQYIKFELLLADIESKNIYCSTKVGLYRAILASTHSVFYYFDITHFEDISYNDGIAVKAHITFRTHNDFVSETISDLQSSLHQSNTFSSNLIQYANLYVNNIQVLTNEIVDPTIQDRRRLRG